MARGPAARPGVPVRPEAETDVEALTLVCLPREADLKVVGEMDERESAETTAEVDYDRQEVVQTFDTADVDMVRRQLRSTIDRHGNI